MNTKNTLATVAENACPVIVKADPRELAEALPAVAGVLKAEGLSQKAVTAALLSLCGVRVDFSDVKSFSIHGL
ncbi:MAG: hypothetical protein LBC55_09880 [Desulfovibrio sp.]|jgi:hypothetical protein|nr:hypothetical protein [Desulfovibrio sp.]